MFDFFFFKLLAFMASRNALAAARRAAHLEARGDAELLYGDECSAKNYWAESQVEAKFATELELKAWRAERAADRLWAARSKRKRAS